MPSWDGSSLADWTVTNATVDAALGNPAPSFNCNPSQRAYVDAGAQLCATIEFDVYINGSSVGLCDLFFGCDSSGKGQICRLDSRGGTNYCGIAASASWTSWSTPSAGSSVTALAWHHVKIEIDQTIGTTARLYIDDVLIGTYSITLRGQYIGIHGDGGSNGAHFDNISVTGGVVLAAAGPAQCEKTVEWGAAFAIASLPDPKYVYKDKDRGDGTMGTLNASNISEAAGSGSDLSPEILKIGEVVDDVTGTLSGGGGGTAASGYSW